MAHMDYSGDEPCLVDKWYIEDVQEQHRWVTDEQAVKVLETMARHHDASIGYTFELIDIWVDRMFPEPDCTARKEQALRSAGFVFNYLIEDNVWEIYDPSDKEGYHLSMTALHDLVDEAYMNVFSGESHVESI